MHTFTLTDWVTVRGAGASNTVTQSESEWLDLTQYEDVCFWIDVKEVTGTVTLNVQTSPTKDESFFTNIYTNAALAAGIVNPGSTGGKVIMATTSGVPVARYVRWQLSSATNPYDATFRIFISANAPGA
jgi:hypothetical protein